MSAGETMAAGETMSAGESKVGGISYVYLAGALFISGSAIVAGKIMVGALPTFLAAWLSVAIGLLLLIPLTFFVKKETVVTDLKTNGTLLSQALFGVLLYRVFAFYGLRFTTAATSGLITSASPALVALLAVLLLKEKLSKHKIIGVLLVSIGLVVINLYPFMLGDAGGIVSFKGNMMVFAAVLCEALFAILSKSPCKPISALYRTTVITFYAFVLLLPLSVYDVLQYDWTGFSLSAGSIVSVLYFGVFVSFLSYILWFKGIENVPAGNAAVFTSIVPVSSIILSALILKEAISLVHIIGLIFIICGIFISAVSNARSSQKMLL